MPVSEFLVEVQRLQMEHWKAMAQIYTEAARIHLSKD
jgi:hypothetical protein